MCLALVDLKIRRGNQLLPKDAICILNEGIRLHQWALKTFDPSTILGEPSGHKKWIDLYEDIIQRLNREPFYLDAQYHLQQLHMDADIHQWYLDHLDYAIGAYGGIKHHKKWKARWLAIVQLLEAMNNV